MAEEHDAGHATNPIPTGKLGEAAQKLLAALADRAVEAISGKLTGMTDRLTDFAHNGGPGLMAAVTGSQKLASGASPTKAALSAGMTMMKEKAGQAVGAATGGGASGGGGGGHSAKVVNIVEQADIGLPVRVVYDQWTQFEQFPSFTRKVEKVEQETDEKVNWRAQIFFSHRDWEATITEQVPDERIVWHAKGAKGYPDGTVTFHELTPDLTRILLVIEYHPQGFFEKTANLWRAQGRRVRSDFKHIKRHLMTRTILEQDQVEGWRGEIRDGEVVLSHEDAMKEEQQAQQKQPEQEPGQEKEQETRQETRQEKEQQPTEKPTHETQQPDREHAHSR
jgi:uncharacterized membrane protein